MLLGNNSEARVSFKQLINRFPESMFVTEAKIKILFTYFNEGNYATVIDAGQKLIQKPIAKDDLLAVYVLLGDSYAATNFPIDSVYYYSMAYANSNDSDRKILTDKIKEPAASMNRQEIQSLLNLMDSRLLQGHFLYLIGLAKSWHEKYEDALFILSTFVKNFPGNQNIPRATILIKEIENKSNYNHQTIGCLLPLTGPYKTFGNRALRGIELALHQFLSKNTGKHIDLIVKDTESDNNRSVEAVRELYNKDKVAAVIGPVFTAEAACAEAQRLALPIIAITQKPKITETGKYVFRNFFTPEMQVKAIASYAFEKLGLERFAILYPDDNYGNRFMSLFWDEVVAHNGQVVGLESYSPNQTDFADSIKKLVGLYYQVPKYLKKEIPYDKKDDLLLDIKNIVENENAESETDKKSEAIVDFQAIFIPDGPKRVGLIIPQLAYHDVNGVYFLGTNLWHSGKLIMMAKQYIQGAIMPDIFFSKSKSKHVKNFVGDFENTFKENPGFIEAVSYDTAMILFNLVIRPDISFRSTLISELGKIKNYNGVTGLTSFNPNGEVEKKLYLLKIYGSNFREVE